VYDQASSVSLVEVTVRYSPSPQVICWLAQSVQSGGSVAGHLISHAHLLGMSDLLCLKFSEQNSQENQEQQTIRTISGCLDGLVTSSCGAAA
jgi:hypothetical protein